MIAAGTSEMEKRSANIHVEPINEEKGTINRIQKKSCKEYQKVIKKKTMKTVMIER